ncbi:MAG: ZIP family metal transporter [Eubacteriales bacterium]|nr:ZIP family metal transporter [Eubacteriales bacterium]
MTIHMNLLAGILVPFAGTTFGAACVFLLKKQMSLNTQKIFSGFAAGVMVAASVWSLLIPALEQSEHLGRYAFFPAAAGFLLGIGFLLILDQTIPHLHPSTGEHEGMANHLRDTTKLMLAVTLHNIPEGIAVGVVYAGFLKGNASISISGAMALSIGIAIQNFPEGAVISMPLQTRGVHKGRAFIYGMLSGIVEPIAAGITIFLAGIMIPILPYLLSFAAGAMLYVVVEELIPELSQGKHSNIGVISFSLGFVLMMILDVALS